MEKLSFSIAPVLWRSSRASPWALPRSITFPEITRMSSVTSLPKVRSTLSPVDPSGLFWRTSSWRENPFSFMERADSKEKVWVKACIPSSSPSRIPWHTSYSLGAHTWVSSPNWARKVNFRGLSIRPSSRWREPLTNTRSCPLHPLASTKAAKGMVQSSAHSGPPCSPL